MAESIFRGVKNRIFAYIARFIPGALTVRPALHRWRGVAIGKNVWIGYDAIIETSYPELVRIHDNVGISVRATLIAHYREIRGIEIEEFASIGPGAIIMPGVTVGRGSIVTAGTVVTKSVPPLTVVQGNPAVAIARLTAPVTRDHSARKLVGMLRPIER